MRRHNGRGTTFGEMHSCRHLNLIQQKVEIGPAPPNLKLIEVPGSNGFVDLTEAQGLISYGTREIKWTFALYPGDDWPTRFSTISNLLNGKRLKATLDNDRQWYYEGRVQVSEQKLDKLLRQITVTMYAMPHKRRHVETSLIIPISSTPVHVGLAIGEMPTVPVLTSNRPFTVTWGSVSEARAEGTHTIPALRMAGDQEIILTSNSSAGIMTVAWREGSL